MATKFNDGKLIECVKNFPSIYDKNHGSYRSKQSKINAWITIGEKLKIPEELCEQRWIVLRNRYSTELRRNKRKPGTNNSILWQYAETMSFLEEFISPRKTRGSLLMGNNSKCFLKQENKSAKKFNQNFTSSINGIPPEALVSVELRSASPNNNMNNSNNINNANSSTSRLRPIAPRPAFATVARFVKFEETSDSSIGKNGVRRNNLNCQSQSSDCKEKQEDDDEDILFGKSIGYTLRNIRNKKTKLQVKSEILSILAQHTE